MFPRAQVNPSNSSFLHKRPKSSQTKFLITDVCRITSASVNVHVTQAPLRYWPLFGCLFAGLLSLSATHGTSRAVNNSPPNTHTFFSKLYFQFSQVSQDHCENYQSQRQMFTPPLNYFALLALSHDVCQQWWNVMHTHFQHTSYGSLSL